MKQPESGGLGEILDALDTGLIILDRDKKVVGWNGWVVSATRVSAEEAAGRTLEEIFPPEPLRRLLAAVDNALHAGTSSLLTHSLNPDLLPLHTRAGRSLIHDVSVRPLGPRSEARCLIQIVDVTLAAERERLLRARQNARYAAVVDNAPDAIVTLSAEGIVEFANAAVHRELGYPLQDLVGLPLRGIFADASEWDRIWPRLAAGEALPAPVSLAVIRRDGSTSHVELSASRWTSEMRVYVTAILRDVTDRHAAEAKLRHLNETLEERVVNAIAERNLLADIVETTDAFIQVVDLSYRILAVNKASADEFERIFGVRPEVGDDVLDLLAAQPEQRDRLEALWRRALAGENFTVVQELGDPARDRRHYEMKFSSLRGSDDRLVAAFQFVYDVSERLEHQAQLARTEEALRHAQKMEAIGQLTGGIAHDFNNLLMGISGSIELLRRRIAAGKYDETQRFMDAAVASANRAAALTHRLLAFARRQPLDTRSVDVNHLVRDMEDLLRRSLNEQIELRISLAPDLWATLTDANQLENALLNLAINARDAMPDGGLLSISTRNEELDRPVRHGSEEIEAGSYTVIRVADTGVGMPPEVVSKVFEPFFTTKPIGQGTGLGLSMIYGFVKQSRGHVRIESAPGEGTAVVIYLPRSDEEPLAGREAAVERPSVASGEVVLLVEDDPSVRLLIGEVLSELGYACVEATDGQAAEPILRSNIEIDLMITDIGLPGMNGHQLADIARRYRPQLKILFVTGYAEHATGNTGFLRPGMELATKPFILDSLALKIREMLAAPARRTDTV
ncbi:PAS domain-containing hybrid sensor histidine kinase/response regulator [Labrys monachus]|uniref:histidine kinase n=1 Tax=Labrys monachus TaxID=217067 RepID=A0ABU0FNB9_9HYPH|nr:PAS domain-containing protein [Labrys monachus]MDQ0395520.1 PAS domain S-box-containing protein [Labrys monachus]